MILTLILVMVATGLGSVFRYLLMQHWPSRASLLSGVLGVNVVGSLLLGMLVSIPFSHEWAVILETGFLGGLTTFSSMMTEGVDQDTLGQKVLYFVIQMGAGILAFTIGCALFH